MSFTVTENYIENWPLMADGREKERFNKHVTQVIWLKIRFENWL